MGYSSSTIEDFFYYCTSDPMKRFTCRSNGNTSIFFVGALKPMAKGTDHYLSPSGVEVGGVSDFGCVAI